MPLGYCACALLKCASDVAQVLFSSDGYAYLDVRPTLELEEVGRVKDSVNIPLYNSIRKYDAEKGEKVRGCPWGAIVRVGFGLKHAILTTNWKSCSINLDEKGGPLM